MGQQTVPIGREFVFKVRDRGTEPPEVSLQVQTGDTIRWIMERGTGGETGKVVVPIDGVLAWQPGQGPDFEPGNDAVAAVVAQEMIFRFYVATGQCTDSDAGPILIIED